MTTIIPDRQWINDCRNMENPDCISRNTIFYDPEQYFVTIYLDNDYCCPQGQSWNRRYTCYRFSIYLKGLLYHINRWISIYICISSGINYGVKSSPFPAFSVDLAAVLVGHIQIYHLETVKQQVR